MFQTTEYIKKPFMISTDRNKVNVDKVCEFLSQSYWANTRKRDTIIKSLEHSLCFSLFYENTQVGFARVVTDGATFAYLCDVFIDEAYRGKGLGKWMLECVLQHPDIGTVRRFLLATKDAHDFYRQFSFQELKEPERFMEKLNEQ